MRKTGGASRVQTTSFHRGWPFALQTQLVLPLHIPQKTSIHGEPQNRLNPHASRLPWYDRKSHGKSICSQFDMQLSKNLPYKLLDFSRQQRTHDPLTVDVSNLAYSPIFIHDEITHDFQRTAVVGADGKEALGKLLLARLEALQSLHIDRRAGRCRDREECERSGEHGGPREIYRSAHCVTGVFGKEVREAAKAGRQQHGYR